MCWILPNDFVEPPLFNVEGIIPKSKCNVSDCVDPTKLQASNCKFYNEMKKEQYSEGDFTHITANMKETK